MCAAGIFFKGQFTLFTYIRPFLENVTKVNSDAVTLILLLIGVAGLAGTTAIGFVIKNRLYQTLVGIPLVMASVAVILIPMGNNIPTVCVLLGLWGVLSTAAPVGWWSWVASATASDTESGGGLMVATVQFSIALGSTVGGILFDQFGFQSTFALSAGILIFSAILTLWTSKLRTVPV